MITLKTFKAQRDEAIRKLVELGVMKYVKDMDIYHGRAGNGSGWKVNPNFNNAGNNTGNRNVAKISVLYTAELDVAKRFARARLTEANPQAETYKIVPQSPDYVIFDRTFEISSLTPRQMAEFNQAIRTLTQISICKLSPIQFEYRTAYPHIKAEIQRRYAQTEYGLFKDGDIDEICNNLTNNSNVMRCFKDKSELEECVTQIISASNSRRLMQLVPSAQLGNALSDAGSMLVSTPEGKQFTVKTSTQYVLSLCNELGIVGVKGYVHSATLHEDIEVVEIFNLKSIATEQQLQDTANATSERFGEISPKINSIFADQEVNKFFQEASASEIMQYVYQNKKLKDIFLKSSGVWEGYTVGQHTEAVLKFLDDYKLAEIPKQILPFIKIAILAHDIGKGYAIDRNSEWRGKHKLANKAFARELFAELGVDSKYWGMLDFIFAEGQEFTSFYYFGGSKQGDVAQQKDEINRNMLLECQTVLRQTFNANPSMNEIKALQKLCIVLQHCDSGAYTRYATINGGEKLYYHGGSDNFTSSFVIGSDGNPRLKTFKDIPTFTSKL